MYTSVQPVSFTDEELESIYRSIEFDYQDCILRYSGIDDDPDYPGPITGDDVKAALAIFRGILDKIDKSGIFSRDLEEGEV